MNFFGNRNKSDPPTAGQGTGNFASGAEQDRHASHFGIGDAGVDKIKDAAWKVASYKGEGAEQDRYGSYFKGLSLDQQQVRKAAQSIINAQGSGAEQDRHASHFGLGADGLAQARMLAAAKGEGAEQNLYGSHFGGIDGRDVQQAAQSVEESAKHAIERR